MMGTPWGSGLNTLAEVIFDPVEDDGCMIDGIHLRPCQGKGVLCKLEITRFQWRVRTYHPGQTLYSKLVDIYHT